LLFFLHFENPGSNPWAGKHYLSDDPKKSNHKYAVI
jgi:hypothetical protein